MFNVTEIPEVFSDLLGLELEPTSILISLVCLMVLSITLAILELDIIGVIIADLSLLAFFCLMGWFPVWIFIIISILVAVLFARKTVSVISGG